MTRPKRGRHVLAALGVAAALLAPARRARGDVQPLASLPMVIGADHRSGAAQGTGFAIGARPELVLAFDHDTPTFGLGIYGDAVSEHPAIGWLGGGGTAVLYLDPVGVALSGGADQRFSGGTSHTVPVVSGFFGLRSNHSEMTDNGWPLELPFGVRADVRPGSGDVPTSVALSLQLDVGGAIAFFAYLAAHPEFGH